MPDLHGLGQLLALSPETLWHAVAMLSFLFLLNYLVRTGYMSESPRCVAVHMVVCLLTLLPAVILAAVLIWAAYNHPERAWINLVIAALLYVPWYLGGAVTRPVRSDAEGADVGWLTMGALITFPAGVIAAIAFG